MITVLTCLRLRKNTIGKIGHKRAIATISLFRTLARYNGPLPALSLGVAGELLFCPYFLRISLPATILR